MNKLLERQIKKNIKDVKNLSPEVMSLLEIVSQSYDNFERDHLLIERSMEISSEELMLTHESLEKRNKVLEEFAYVLAHDLKSPVRSIVGFNQLIMQRYASLLPEEAKEFMKYVIDSSKQMYNLLNSLLKLSVVNKNENNWTNVNLNHVLEKVKIMISPVASETNTTLEIQEDLPTIWGIEPLIFQLFLNLINNSIKYRSDKPPIIKVNHSTSEEGLHTFSVEDNGIGIEEEYYEKVFLIFKQLNSQSGKGTGIGLALCKQITEKHQGNIWIQAKKENGIIFKFTLSSDNNFFNEQ